MADLTGIHTTSMAITHGIDDLCERQEYIEILRRENELVLRKDDGWQKNAHSELHNVDSSLKASQRFAPRNPYWSTFSFPFFREIRHL